MREHLFATVDLSQQAGRPLSCTYHILIKDITEPIQCESYGVRVTVDQTGERKELPGGQLLLLSALSWRVCCHSYSVFIPNTTAQ